MVKNKSSRLTYILFTSISLLIILIILVFFYLVHKQKYDGTIINIAGRQRMLSQKIAKTCLIISHIEDSTKKLEYYKTLESDLNNFETTHNGLKNGDIKLDLWILNQDSIKYSFIAIQPYFEGIVNNVKNLINKKGNKNESITDILKNEQPFLNLMDDIVFLYDKENQKKISFMQWMITLAEIFIVIILFAVVRWIIMPMIAENQKYHQKQEQYIAQIQEKNLLLQELNDSKDNFFSIISHDLRSPFNAILGFCELLLTNIRQFEIEKSEEFLGHIYTASKNAYNLLNNLLNWAKTQTYQINIYKENFNISFLIDEILSDLQSVAINKHISLEYLGQNKVMLYADQNMLNVILRNLINNAIKFTRSGGNINISIKESNINFEISVADDGVGMIDEIKNKIFNSNINETSLGTASERGVGLGLVICKDFIKKQGGTIWVESEIGKGSNFIFTIPKPLI